MSDTLKVFGTTYTGVTGFKASDGNNGTLTYVRPQGTKNIDSSGTTDVTEYASVSVPAGTEGTPSASKGSVSNHSVSVIPTVTNTGGWISGGTKTGTAVTVSASELVSGSQNITTNNTYDVTNLASVVVNVSSGGNPLLTTYSVGQYSTSSTQATNMNKSFTVSGYNGYDALIVETSVDTKTNNRHAATVAWIFLTASTTQGTKDGTSISTAKWNCKLSSNGTATTRAGTTAYGIYPYSATISNNTLTIALYSRYNSTSTGTINGTYTTRVYGVKLYDLIGG